MNLAIINSRAEIGVQAASIQVEVHIAGGLPGLTLVGLPATAVREARDRVRAALQNSGFKLPPRRITVNLAPADLPKDGARFDLAIALGILQASGQLKAELDDVEFIGELSLSGELKPISGVLPAVVSAQKANRAIVVPAANAEEAHLVNYEQLRLAQNLLQVCAALQQHAPWPTATPSAQHQASAQLDFADVRGQTHAKRALEIAVCGRHNVLMLGPPGSGKSMLAQRIPSIYPELSQQHALELAAVNSSWGNQQNWSQWRQAPFRSPHHSASAAALVGGGSHPRPGEISLAHRGILFLDELPEFRRSVLELMREPMESGEVHLARVRQRICFPAQFQLIAAMNPCPCGYLGDSSGRCHCSADSIQRYQARVSGPLLDRIDMQIHVPRLQASELLQPPATDADNSLCIKQRLEVARQRQWDRRAKLNHALDSAELQEDCRLKSHHRQLLQQAAERLQLSGRAIHRVLKVARSIADLANEANVEAAHLAEALQYRRIAAGI